MYVLISTEFHDLIVLIIKSSANCRTVINHGNIFLQQNNILKNTPHITLYFHHFEEFWCRILNKELHFIFEIWIITNMYLFIMCTICKHKSRICIWWQIRNCFAIHVYIHLHVILSRVSLKNKNIKSILIFFLLLFIMSFQRTTTLFSAWQKMNDNWK